MNLEELEKLQKIGSIAPKVQLNIPITIEEAELLCGNFVTKTEIQSFIKTGQLLSLTKNNIQYINGNVLFNILNKQLENNG